VADDPEREDLRLHLRNESLPAAASILVRGGPDTISLIRSHARRTNRLYCLDGSPLWGVSAFGALDEVGPASLEGLLATRLVTYEQVHTPVAQALLDAGFVLLDSFRRPHFTIRLVDDSPGEASRLLDALGPPHQNPYNRTVRQRPGETR
jgi:hypothetical protein